MIDSPNRWLEKAEAWAVVLLLIANLAGTATAYRGTFVVLGTVALVLWVINLHRLRRLTRAPVSDIASARPGYVQLAGQAYASGSDGLKDPVTDGECAWFRVETWTGIQIGNGYGQGHKVKEAESSRPIILRDATGECRLTTEGARFFVSEPQVIVVDRNIKHYLWRLEPGSPIYAIGELTGAAPPSVADPATSAPAPGTVLRRMNEVLGEWMADRPALVARFDADGDRKLSTIEWERARYAALLEVRRDLQQQPAPHAAGDAPGATSGRPRRMLNSLTMSAPADGNSYLISDQNPARFAQALRVKVFIYFGLILFGIVNVVVLWTR